MIRLTRRSLLGSAAAGTVTWTAPVRADIAADPLGQPLRELYAALEAVMRSGRSTSFPHRFDMLAPIVDRVFDLQTVLKLSIGLRWGNMDPDTRARLLKVYRRFTIATYVANFDKYEGEHFQILPGTRGSGADRIVGTEIITGDDRTRLDYVMRADRGNWRAVDVLLEGSISRVAVQRSDFRSILARGDADALIASLQRKIADLSGGALNS
jgi:phospholipid transport system substrate-binding protein